jgi:hypothetical protein
MPKTAKKMKRALKIGKMKSLIHSGVMSKRQEAGTDCSRHTIIVIAYHLLKKQKNYRDLGGDYFERQNVELQRSRLINKLEALGLKVTVEVKESCD